jgi:hypothetical protein
VPGRAVDGQGAVECGDTVRQAREPAAAGGPRAAAAVVAHLDHEHVPVGGDVDRRLRRLGVLGDVRQRLGDDEVGRDLDGLRSGRPARTR